MNWTHPHDDERVQPLASIHVTLCTSAYSDADEHGRYPFHVEVQQYAYGYDWYDSVKRDGGLARTHMSVRAHDARDATHLAIVQYKAHMDYVLSPYDTWTLYGPSLGLKTQSLMRAQAVNDSHVYVIDDGFVVALHIDARGSAYQEWSNALHMMYESGVEASYIDVSRMAADMLNTANFMHDAAVVLPVTKYA